MDYPFDDEPRLGLITATAEKLNEAQSRAAVIEVVRDARGWKRPSDHVPVIARLGAG